MRQKDTIGALVRLSYCLLRKQSHDISSLEFLRWKRAYWWVWCSGSCRSI